MLRADEDDLTRKWAVGGGGCHLQEKLVAFNARHLAIVVDYQKESAVLGTRVRLSGIFENYGDCF